MNVTLTGPNAHGGMFHVHRAGCRDLDRGVYRASRSMNERYDEEHASVRSVVEGIYSDMIEEAADSTWSDWESYLGEVKFFPCTKALPYEAQAQAAPLTNTPADYYSRPRADYGD